MLIIYIPVDEECWHCPFRTDNAIGDRGPWRLFKRYSQRLGEKARWSEVHRRLQTEQGKGYPFLSFKVTIRSRKKKWWCKNNELWKQVVYCFAPLAELLGYSTTVRIISSGHATFTLEFDRYELMDSANEAEAIKRVTGFY